MLRAIADTHTVIWYLFGDARLSAAARRMMDETGARGDQVGLSTITLAEIIYLTEKGRLAPATLERLLAAIDRADGVLAEVPFDRQVALALRQIEKGAVPDLPDRIIAATAVHLGVPVISRDGEIRAQNLNAIW